MDFLKHVWSPSCNRADLVICSLPHDCDNDVRQKLPDFCRLVLHPGSYCFILLSENHFGEMYKLFKDHSFKVSAHSYKVLYDESTIKRRSTIDFPQKHGDIALLAKSNGTHPRKFKPSFEDVSRRFASLSGVKACQDRLRKPAANAPLVPGEKCPHLFGHIIKTFSPIDGIVIDPLASGLTTALACLKTDRRALCIDPSKDSFPFALGRLRVHVVPGATMESHADYSAVFSPTSDSPTLQELEADPNSGPRTSSTAPESSSTSVGLGADNSPRPPKRRICQLDNAVISTEAVSTIITNEVQSDLHYPAAVQAFLRYPVKSCLNTQTFMYSTTFL